MPPRTSFNPKRKIASLDAMTEPERTLLAEECSYGGNPEHKRDPGDFNLTPPINPRPGKTLCDGCDPILKADAKRLLEEGFAKGMVSERRNADGWPRNVWVVSASGEVFEAQLENPVQGVYHGYPMPEADPFRTIVLEEWEHRQA